MRKVIFFIIAAILLLKGTAFSQDKVWSLEDCVVYAIDNNIQIKQQALQTQIQKNNLDLAKLKLLPTLNASVNHDYTFGRALEICRPEYSL
jgi:outer membrane protein